jgi:hypothetical protein
MSSRSLISLSSGRMSLNSTRKSSPYQRCTTPRFLRVHVFGEPTSSGHTAPLIIVRRACSAFARFARSDQYPSGKPSVRPMTLLANSRPCAELHVLLAAPELFIVQVARARDGDPALGAAKEVAYLHPHALNVLVKRVLADRHQAIRDAVVIVKEVQVPDLTRQGRRVSP